MCLVLLKHFFLIMFSCIQNTSKKLSISNIVYWVRVILNSSLIFFFLKIFGTADFLKILTLALLEDLSYIYFQANKMVKIQGKLGGGLKINQEWALKAEMELFCHLVGILCYSNSYFKRFFCCCFVFLKMF